MAKLRLNREMREALVRFADENVVSTTHEKAVEKAYAAALPLVLAAVRKKYPEADMVVLAKYELAKPDSCLIGYSDAGQQLRFDCREGDAPVVPKGYCASRNYPWSAKCATAIEDYNFKTEQAREDRKRILRDYHALIANYQTAEDVIEIWPAAEAALRGYLDAASRNLPATLPVEAIERIKSLNIGSQRLAA